MLQIIPHVVGLVALCVEISIHLLSKFQTHSVREFLVDTLRKWTCEVLSLHLSVVCSRLPSAENDLLQQKMLKIDTSEVLSKDGKQRISPVYHVAVRASSFIDFL